MMCVSSDIMFVLRLPYVYVKRRGAKLCRLTAHRVGWEGGAQGGGWGGVRGPPNIRLVIVGPTITETRIPKRRLGRPGVHMSRVFFSDACLCRL